MSRAGRGVRQKFSLQQPTQFSFLPLLRESPLLQGCCYSMNPLSRSWLVSWENLVEVWQSKSLCRCVKSQAFSCAAPHGEAVHRMVLPGRIQPDSAEVQNKKICLWIVLLHSVRKRNEAELSPKAHPL